MGETVSHSGICFSPPFGLARRTPERGLGVREEVWIARRTPEQGHGVREEGWTASRTPERCPGVREVTGIDQKCHNHQPFSGSRQRAGADKSI